MHNKPFRIAKTASAILETTEIRARARNIDNDPDLTNFEHILLETDVAGRDRADVPLGPSQSRRNRSKSVDGAHSDGVVSPAPFDWGGLEPAPRSNQLMLEHDQDEDLDGGIDWDSDDSSSDNFDVAGDHR
ncbi:hypothetical protein AB5I39_09710 [Sphingomonas sp. MMS24-J45]|uniref:hypothetical protein n=1 Tax=Sphingomonas sp. MMS24-J45 TaxID=3238806 RepID=UPI00384D4F4C